MVYTMNSVVSFILSLVIQFIGFILKPIDSLIFSFGGKLGNVLGKVWEFITLICNNLIWVLDLLSIPVGLISIILLFFIFRGTLFLIIYGIKIFVKWWGTLW